MAAVRCRQCGRVFAPAEADGPCPACGSVEVVAEPPVMAPDPPPLKARGWRGRRWTAVIALVAVGLSVLAVVLGWPRLAERRAAQRDREADALCRESETAVREGNYREALARAERAVEAAPEYAPAYARRARARYFLGDEDGALADCDEAIRRDPNLGVAYAYRAPVAWLRDWPAAGVRDGERAIELLPDSPESLTGLALARLQAGDPAGADKAAATAVERAADDPEAHRVRGLVRNAGGNDATADFDAAARLSGDRPFYLAARAEYLIGRAVAITPDEASLKPDEALKLLDRADDDIGRALKSDSNDAVAYLAAGNLRAARERQADMLTACEKAVAANPRCVGAYLRAAENLSPADLRRFQMLQAALAQTLDLRELRGGDFAFGALLTDLQRLATERMKQPVTVYINFATFEVDQRATLRDAKVNLNSLMDVSGENLLRAVAFQTILDVLCRQVGASYWVGPEYIEVVGRQHAAREAARNARLLSHDLLAPDDLYRREERVLLFEQALGQSVDLRQLKGGDFALGALLTEIQRLASSKMRTDIPIYINYESFEPAVRATLRDSKVNLNVLMDATGENLLPAVKVQTIVDQIIRHLGDHARVRATPDFIEVVWTGPSGGGEAAWRPLRHQPKPRAESLRWLTRGIEQVPDSARLYLARGQVHLEQYELDAAIADLTRAIEQNPADKRAYRLRSIAYAARGQPEDAARARADALATKP